MRDVTESEAAALIDRMVVELRGSNVRDSGRMVSLLRDMQSRLDGAWDLDSAEVTLVFDGPPPFRVGLEGGYESPPFLGAEVDGVVDVTEELGEWTQDDRGLWTCKAHVLLRRPK